MNLKMLSNARSLITAWLLSATIIAASHDSRSPQSHRRAANNTYPVNYGVVVFQAMLLQDMIGVVDPLQLLANNFHMNLYIISETLEPVTTEPASATMNPYNSSFWPKIVPTHTFANAPDDIEVLVVPGGPGIRAPDVSAITDFIADTYPKLRYLFTICTGAGLAAKAGVLDGRRATTNKHAWDTIRAMGPDVEWVSPARWVVDGNIWSSSSGTAGLDLTFAWINSTFGPEWADKASGIMEYMPNAQDFDPFAAKYNVTPTGW